MARKDLAARLRSEVRHFCAARDGNIAVIFALAALPIMGLIGVTIDYSRASAVRADLQSALDATALMVSKNAATLSADELQTSAKAYFTALFDHPEAGSATVTAKYNADGGSSVVVEGSTSIKTDFGGIFALIGGPQFSKLDVSSTSTVAWGTSKLQVALVLDNTGSMAASGKMGALKAAGRNLLKQLEAAAQKPGDVRVAIVPFAVGVNVELSNDTKDAAWLDWSSFTDEGGGGWDGDNNGGSNNNNNNSNNNSNNSSNNNNGNNSNNNNNNSNNNNNNNNNNNQVVNKSKWKGCVIDRDQDHDVLNTTPSTSNKSTLFPVSSDKKDCPQALMPLSYDWAALKQKVNEMSPQGYTNQTIGLAWGWQALSQGVPLSAPVADKDTQRVIILFTDGLNTENRWTKDPSKIDERTAKACANIKAAGITLYTVQVKGNGDPTSAILQKCATDSKKFFALDSADQIVTAFNTIGTNLSQLRLAK